MIDFCILQIWDSLNNWKNVWIMIWAGAMSYSVCPVVYIDWGPHLAASRACPCSGIWRHPARTAVPIKPVSHWPPVACHQSHHRSHSMPPIRGAAPRWRRSFSPLHFLLQLKFPEAAAHHRLAELKFPEAAAHHRLAGVLANLMSIPSA
jgi:hypothetical protein